MNGRPVRIVFRRRAPSATGGPVHAATFLRERRMVLERALLADPAEFTRIFVHELFHFAWLRLSNARRRSYEQVVAAELRRGTRGELGWSAESRKEKLARRDCTLRTRRWREYCCESFCDSAAWLYAGLRSHQEFTLARAARVKRHEWFIRAGLSAGVAI